jgi:hypothetical protein
MGTALGGRYPGGMRLVQIFDSNVLERFALGVMPRQAAQSRDDIDLLGESAPPAIGFRLGRQDGVHDRLLVGAQQSAETFVWLALGVDPKLVEKDSTATPLRCKRNDLSGCWTGTPAVIRETATPASTRHIAKFSRKPFASVIRRPSVISQRMTGLSSEPTRTGVSNVT